MRAIKLLLLFTVFAFSLRSEASMCFDGSICNHDELIMPVIWSEGVPFWMPFHPGLRGSASLGNDFVLVLNGVVVPACYYPPVIVVVPEPARISPVGPPPGFPWGKFMGWMVGVGMVIAFVEAASRREERSTSG